jgi:hypothetical protein
MKPEAATYDFEEAYKIIEDAFSLFEKCHCVTSLRYALNIIGADIPGFESRTRDGVSFLIEFGIIEIDDNGCYRLIK